jgi:hypothetical protein
MLSKILLPFLYFFTFLWTQFVSKFWQMLILTTADVMEMCWKLMCQQNDSRYTFTNTLVSPPDITSRYIMTATDFRVIGFLTTRTEIFFETLVYSPHNHLTPLLARLYFIEFSRRETLNIMEITILYNIHFCLFLVTLSLKMLAHLLSTCKPTYISVQFLR